MAAQARSHCFYLLMHADDHEQFVDLLFCLDLKRLPYQRLDPQPGQDDRALDGTIEAVVLCPIAGHLGVLLRYPMA